MPSPLQVGLLRGAGIALIPDWDESWQVSITGVAAENPKAKSAYRRRRSVAVLPITERLLPGHLCAAPGLTLMLAPSGGRRRPRSGRREPGTPAHPGARAPRLRPVFRSRRAGEAAGCIRRHSPAGSRTSAAALVSTKLRLPRPADSPSGAAALTMHA